MEKGKRDNWKRIYIIVIIAFLVSIALFGFSLFLRQSVVLDKKEIPISLSISNSTGFNVTNYSISFGKLSSGNAASKDIRVKNNYNFPIVLEISIEGDVRDLVIYNPIVNLFPAEEKNLSFSTIQISNQSYGNYSGKAIIVFKRA